MSLVPFFFRFFGDIVIVSESHRSATSLERGPRAEDDEESLEAPPDRPRARRRAEMAAFAAPTTARPGNLIGGGAAQSATPSASSSMTVVSRRQRRRRRASRVARRARTLSTKNLTTTIFRSAAENKKLPVSDRSVVITPRRRGAPRDVPSVHSALIAMPTPPLRLKVLCALVNAVVVACGVRNVFFPATPLPFIPDDDKARSSDYTGSHTTPSA
jgi:hypothetical protein